jgi:hypothetical protein
VHATLVATIIFLRKTNGDRIQLTGQRRLV